MHNLFVAALPFNPLIDEGSMSSGDFLTSQFLATFEKNKIKLFYLK